MVKHKDILDNLDSVAKVALVTSGLKDDPLDMAGVPKIGRASLEDLARDASSSYDAMARSWNVDLVEKYTAFVAGKAGEQGAKLLVSPDLKARINPYSAGMSEDPMLSGAYGAAVVRGVHSAGAAVGLGSPSLTAEDVAWLDLTEDPAAVYELVSKPFERAVAGESAEAIFLTPAAPAAGYRNTNRALFADAVNGRFGEVFVVGDDTTPTSDSLSLLKGKVSLGGAALPLERASRRYRQLAAYRDEGSITDRDVDEAVRSGSALTDERLDEAADKIVDFAINLAELSPVSPEGGDETELRAATESIVLLKNERTLPLGKKCKLAVIGEAYEDLSPLEEKYEITGRALGYERLSDRSDAMIPEALRACRKANVVLLFLHPDPDGKTLSLPPNRLALISALAKTRKKIVALVVGDRTVDLSFDKKLDATLIVPDDGPKAGRALATILSGEESPSGKLTRSAIDDADEYYADFKENRDGGFIKVGSFIGYRRFQAEYEDVRYPFGFGLSYTTFAYSGLSADREVVSFTVTNKGKFDGAEVVEIYVGGPDKTGVAPKKRLATFTKVFLKAGESQKVTLPLPETAFETFDPAVLSDDVEAGDYRLYVCSSCEDVRLSAKVTVEGVTREKSDEGDADYFIGTDYEKAEEVGKDGRITEEKTINVPKNMLRAKKWVMYALPVLAFIFFVLLTMLVFAYALDYGVTVSFRKDVAEWFMYIIAVVAIVPVPFLLNFNRKRLKRLCSAAMFVCPVLLFATIILGYLVYFDQSGTIEEIAFKVMACLTVAVPLMTIVAAVTERELESKKGGTDRWAVFYEHKEKDIGTTSRVDFEKAFNSAKKETVEEKSLVEPIVPQPPPLEQIREQTYQFYDKYLTLETMLGDCKLFVTERGVAIDDATLRNYIAALFSSQLIIIPSGNAAELVSAVAEYLGHKVYVDNGELVSNSEDLFARWKPVERKFVSTMFGVALEDAAKEAVFVHTALIRHVGAAGLSRVLAPITDVLSRRKTGLTTPDGKNVLLPQNLYVAIEVDTDEKIQLSPEIAEVAALFEMPVELTEPALKKTAVQTVGYGRMMSLRHAVRDEFSPSEDTWKKVDKLDSMSRAAHIGNLVWIKTELHASVVMSCGGTETEAIEGALECEALPWLRAVWDDEKNGVTLDAAIDESFERTAEAVADRPKRATKTKRKSKVDE